jgi:cell division protein FtsB
MREGDDRLFVQFYMGSVKNAAKSEEAGHPVFDDLPFVKIIVPGDKNTIIDTVADNSHKQRFARAWEQFQRNEEQIAEGWPLREWPAITRAQADELRHMNIVTVEQLANLSDVHGSKIMGYHELKRKAQTALTVAKDQSVAQKLAAQNETLKGQVAALEAQLKELSDRFDRQNASNKHR